MAAILLKLASAFMSVIVFFSGTFPVLFDGKQYINPYSDDVHVCEFYYFPQPEVISDYETFSNLGRGGCIVYDAPEDYDSEFFKTKSLACFSVKKDHEDFRVFIKSIKENGDTLDVEYCVISDTSIHAAIYSVYTCEILIEVSKDIKNINLISSEKTISYDVEKLPLEFPEPY